MDVGTDYIEHIHDALVSLVWPGTEPIGEREQRDRPLIESAAGRPFQTIFQEDAYPAVLDKAVALFHSIIANHAFVNGNKRTAVIAIDHFLIANDYCLLLTNDPMYKIAEKTASYKERGETQDQILAEIKSALDDSILSVDVVRRTVGSEEKYITLIRRFEVIQTWIRSNPHVRERD